MAIHHLGFIPCCRHNPDFPCLLIYHCVIHQQAVCAEAMGLWKRFDPCVKIVNSICSKATQHKGFKVLLEELSAEYEDLLLHMEIRWLSRSRVLQRFLSPLGEIKKVHGVQKGGNYFVARHWVNSGLSDRYHLNYEVRGQSKNVSDVICALNTFRANMNFFSVHLQINNNNKKK